MANLLVENSEILNILRSKEFQTFTLMGNQVVASQSYSKVYLNKKEKLGYVDIKGLPVLAQGKVYQLWSLKMEPFTPTDIGLIDEARNLPCHKFMFWI